MLTLILVVLVVAAIVGAVGAVLQIGLFAIGAGIVASIFGANNR